MLISICIPEYNSENYLDSNIQSILAQTYQNIEIVLVDDASKDGTAKKMQQYGKQHPEKLRCYYATVNQGIGATKNEALAHAHGDYVFFCDCDDLLKPNCIEALAAEAERTGFPDMVIDGFTRVDMQGNLLYERKYANVEQALQQSIPLFAKLIKRSFLEKNQIKSPIGVILEDVLYQARTVPLRPTVAKIDNCGYIWVKNTSSASHTRLTGFRPNTLELGISYLAEGSDTLQTTEQKTCMLYYVMQFVTWHLLRSGSGAGGRNTRTECHRAIELLKQCFPQYSRIDYVSFVRPFGTRRVIRWAVLGMALLMKLHLAGLFCFVYGSFNFSKFWPDL